MTTPPNHLPTIWLAAIAAVLSAASSSSGQDAPEPLPSDPVFSALLTDGQVVAGRVRTLSADGRVELVDDEGDTQVIEAGRLIKLSRSNSGKTRVAPEYAVLVFPGGDQLRGLIDSADERAVIVRSSVAGELEVPLDAVLGFTTGTPRDAGTEAEVIAALREEPRTSDLLLLENGDRREVTFDAMTAAEVSYLDADRALRIPRESVRAVGLDPGLVRPPQDDGLSFDLILSDGSRLRLLDPASAAGRLTGATSFGTEVDVALDRIASLYVLGGAVAYLSDLEAAREVTVPYIGPARPARADGSVLGGPLTVDGERIVRGLGTQSRSLLAYRLGPADRRFQAGLALDDAAGPLGNVIFRILVDGEERFASPPISVGEDPLTVDVDVQGGQFLILATEYGRGGGVRDYAAWIEARLIRAQGAPEGGSTPPDPGN